MAKTAVRYKSLVLLLLSCCSLMLPLRGSVFIQCFAVHYFVSFLVLQSS